MKKHKTRATGIIIGLLFFCVAPLLRADTTWPEIALIEWQEDGATENGFRAGILKRFPDARFYVYSAAGDPDILEILLESARERQPDLYYVSGTPAARTLLKMDHETPVIFTMIQAPVEEGIIASWNNSETNATGISNGVPVLNQLKALKRVIRFKELGVFFNPENPESVQQVTELMRIRPFLGFRLHKFPLRSKRDWEKFTLPASGVDSVYLPYDPLIHRLGSRIIARCNKEKIPVLAADMTMVSKNGALLGLVPDNYQIGRLAALNGLAVLSGAPPSEVPSRSLDFFMVVLNMKTARKIGVQVPFSLLVIADSIIR